MKKVLVCSLTDHMGGAELVLEMIARNLKGCEVRRLFLNRCEHGPELGRERGRFSQVVGFVRFARRNRRWDRIHTSHTAMTALVGVMIRLGILRTRQFVARESTTVFTRFSGLKLLIYRLMYRIGYGPVDLLICQTDEMRRQLCEAMPKLARRITIRTIPNPVDLSAIARDAAVGEPQVASHATPRDVSTGNFPRPYIVSAGRLIPEKGFDVLISAFAELWCRRPDMSLVILGEGGERERLEALAVSLGLSDRVLLPGFCGNVYPWFGAAALCVVSSRVEGFPNVLLQMMSQNTAVVSTLCAGGIEALDGVVTCAPADVGGLRDAMAACLEADEFGASNGARAAANRALFDAELRRRSIGAFLDTIDNELKAIKL